MLSIIIPALNEVERLPGTLGALTVWPDAEVIVVDGGSTDGTIDLAQRRGAIVCAARRSRGRQLAAGARASSGDWLLFLHADTRLATGWENTVRRFMADPPNRRRVGYFEFRLDDPATRARILERRVAWRSRRLGLPYGDQGVLIHRGYYFALGGFRALPLFEDVDLVRRVGARRLDALPSQAITSAERYRRTGYRLQSARNVTLLILYFLGVPARWLNRLYR